ncbi:MAG TPA: tyrosine-type recombinase/integrase, partial [Tepidiformaceae bacterium]|nr:tyrosine-type recombinase/integrase [Tepidiformaceae bacterium]
RRNGDGRRHCQELFESLDGFRSSSERQLGTAAESSQPSPREAPRHARAPREADARKIEMWTRVLGASKDPGRITRKEWDAFITARSSGAIDGRGHAVSAEKRRAVGNRVVEIDLVFLRAVQNWATTWEEQPGRRLLRENPIRGFEAPTERNPSRPVASDDRYEAVRGVSDQVTMRVRVGGKETFPRSYLSELLDIAQGTGRRISAICQLRYDDLRLARTSSAPHGAIRWPGSTDKEGREWMAPIDAKVRAALDRILGERPGIGAAYLFPSPADAAQPIDYGLASEWLRRAEKLGGVPKLERGIWHPYRRKWATARKHLPLADVAAAGGWKGTQTLTQCYQQPDDATILAVVLGGAELREMGVPQLIGSTNR